MTRIDIIAVLVGLAVVVVGVLAIHVPTGVIVAGLGVIGIALWPSRRG